MHGPASYDGGAYKAPTWPKLPLIEVLDTVAPPLGALRKRMWRELRGKALEKWSKAGLKFVVVEGDPEKYPKYDENNPNFQRWDPDTFSMLGDEVAFFESLMVQPYLRLMRMPGLYFGTVCAVSTWLPSTNPAAVACYKMGATFWLASLFRRKFLLTHEIGHCLGLNHRPQDENNHSVMNGKVGGYGFPDEHDLASLRAYYLGQ